MSKDEKSVTENLAEAQDTLYLLEESARGLRTQMRSNGWQDDTSEAVAGQWFARALAMSLDHADAMTADQLGKVKDSGWELLGKVLAVTVALLALPAVVIFCIAGFRWALG